MPLLSTYLGHVNPASTYWYLRAVPGAARRWPRAAAATTLPGARPMTALAPTLQAFFTDRLISQRQASPHTIAAYRDTFRLLLRFSCRAAPASRPRRLDFADLDAP